MDSGRALNNLRNWAVVRDFTVFRGLILPSCLLNTRLLPRHRVLLTYPLKKQRILPIADRLLAHQESGWQLHFAPLWVELLTC